MGDKSPKSKQKNMGQKQAKNDRQQQTKQPSGGDKSPASDKKK